MIIKTNLLIALSFTFIYCYVESKHILYFVDQKATLRNLNNILNNFHLI